MRAVWASVVVGFGFAVGVAVAVGFVVAVAVGFVVAVVKSIYSHTERHMTITWDEAGEWVSDENGNRNSLGRWGSREAAEKALRSLKDCTDCTDCSDCSDCTYCSYCSYCTYCSRCMHCTDCTRCMHCTDCTRRADRNEASNAVQIPKIEDLHKKVYQAASQPNALDMSNWHTCDTTHCRAGWIVHLAGSQGYALEAAHNTELAAMLISRESGAPINPAKFHESNDAAIADMKRMAGV